MSSIIGSLVSCWYQFVLQLVFKCNKYWMRSVVFFWLGYEMQLDHLLLNLFLYKDFISSAGKQAGVSLGHFPLCFCASFLLTQRWKHVLICCVGGGVSWILAPGQQLSHICLHVDKEWLQDVPLLSWLCIEPWSVQNWACVYIGTDFACFPLTLLLFLLIQLLLFVMKFYLQLHCKRVPRHSIDLAFLYFLF